MDGITPAARIGSGGGRGPVAELEGGERARIARARLGDPEAFEELTALHSPRLYRMLVRVLGNPAEAEEVTQEALLRAWRGLAGFRGESRFETWLYRIALNEANRRSADEARRPLTAPIDEDALEVADPSDEPPDLATAAEFEDVLERCLAELPASHRTAVVLRDVEGFSNAEAADVLGLGLANFKTRLHRGRMALRQRLEEHWREESAAGALAAPP